MLRATFLGWKQGAKLKLRMMLQSRPLISYSLAERNVGTRLVACDVASSHRVWPVPSAFPAFFSLAVISAMLPYFSRLSPLSEHLEQATSCFSTLKNTHLFWKVALVINFLFVLRFDELYSHSNFDLEKPLTCEIQRWTKTQVTKMKCLIPFCFFNFPCPVTAICRSLTGPICTGPGRTLTKTSGQWCRTTCGSYKSTMAWGASLRKNPKLQQWRTPRKRFKAFKFNSFTLRFGPWVVQ